jgi:antitoxin component YwqK of YwqJK toxin-antitoxin module
MKGPYIIIALLAIMQLGTGQIVEDEHGLFYTENHVLYNGTYTENYDSGKPRVIMNFKDGRLDGDYFQFFENGQLHEQRSYRNGMFDGRWITWNDAGIKIAEAGYRNDKKHGKWYIWDDTGILRYEM